MTSITETGATFSREGARDHAAARALLAVTALLVFAIVIVGGATRLTESGLSITEWELVTGVLPPLSNAQWLAEFEKYRQIPQYQIVNRGMSLAEFQTIYLWEWGHRLLGRVIGGVYLLGFVWLLATRRIGGALAAKMFGVGLLIGLQGAVGWWMVTSGLTADRVAVAPYRLATHLTLALVIFACLVALWLSLGDRARVVAAPARIRWTAALILGLVFVQVVVGALVAGTRSGYAYQTWPLIDGAFIPSGLFDQTPWWKNLFESTLTTQVIHRLIAYGLVLLVLVHLWDVRRAVDDPGIRLRAVLLTLAILVQAGIGIATLLSGMTLMVALSHQAWIVPVIAIGVAHAMGSRGVGGVARASSSTSRA